VLGEFGTGKTWFAPHYPWKALQRYREAQQRGLERPRLPLVIPLRDYSKAGSVESLFSEFFFRKHEIPIPGYSAFEQLNRMGKLLLMFDGFDEMAARVDRQEMINNFWELAKVVVPGAKVILTCRTEHFPDAKEGRALLNAELQASTRDLTGETPQFEVLELEKFNDEQIRQVLEHQAQPATVEQIMGNPQLLDLARRPVLTELILEALPDIEAGKPVDMARVYLYAVRHKMERDIKAERTFTSMADKLYFMCELSWEMLSTDRMSINYREFPDRIRKLFGPAVQEEKDLDHWHYDMMGQTMLIRNAEGDYAPAHRSLLEFFVAYKFAAELGALSADFIELAKMRSPSDSGTEPQDCTWSNYFLYKFDDSSEILHRPPLRKFIREPMGNLRQTVGKSVVTKAVFDLLIPILSPFTQSLKHPLLEVIEATRNKCEESVGYVGGNAVTLLTHLNRNALSYQDLSNTFIQGADLVDASLQETDFAHAHLAKTSLPRLFGSIFSVAYSSNGKLLATAGATCEIDLWNTKDYQLVTNFKGHTDWIRSLTFSADSQFLISTGFDQTIRIWSLNDKKCIKILRGHTNRVNSVVVSSCAKFIISCGDDYAIKVWNFETGQCLKTIEGHTAPVESVVINNEKHLIISGASDKTIKIWDLYTGKHLKSLNGHTHRVRALALSTDGKTLASGSRDQTIRLWHIETGECLNVLTGHSDERVYSVAFSPDGKTLASGCYDQTVRLWDVKTGECIQVLLGHIDWVRTVAFHPSGKMITTGSDDQTVKHWDVETEECITTLQGYTGEIRSVAIAPDEKSLIIGCEDKFLRMWQWNDSDLDILAPPKRYLVLGGESRVNSVNISPDGRFFATASFDPLVRIREVGTGGLSKIFKGHERCVNAITFSSDGNFLASASADCTVRLWDFRSGECIATLDAHENWLWSVAISLDNRLIASGGDDQKIRLWDIRSHACIATIKGHRGGINSVIFTPDNQLLVSAGADQKIRLWDIEKQQFSASWLAHDDSIESLAISSNGERLVSASSDNSIKVWDIYSGELIKVLKGHSGRVRSVIFTPNCSRLISVSSDQTVRVWDFEKGQCLEVLRPLRPYEKMNITGVKGLTESEKATLKSLGAIEN
jgi:WD40 repeat protein